MELRTASQHRPKILATDVNNDPLSPIPNQPRSTYPHQRYFPPKSDPLSSSPTDAERKHPRCAVHAPQRARPPPPPARNSTRSPRKRAAPARLRGRRGGTGDSADRGPSPPAETASTPPTAPGSPPSRGHRDATAALARRRTSKTLVSSSRDAHPSPRKSAHQQARPHVPAQGVDVFENHHAELVDAAVAHDFMKVILVTTATDT